MHRDGTIATKAATDQVVWELDDLQYSIDEGPCVSCHARGTGGGGAGHPSRSTLVTLCAGGGHAHRTTGAARRCSSYTNERVLGGLNLYSTTSASIDPGAIQSAELFATHAALALARARRESDLNDAIATRQVIGMAIGLTMARYNLDSERAFQYLVRASSTSEIKIRDIAEEIIKTANAEAQPETRD